MAKQSSKKKESPSKTRVCTSAEGILKKVDAQTLKSIHSQVGESGLDLKGVGNYPYQLSTGSLKLDLILGPVVRRSNGQWQRGITHGRMLEIYGPESTGKTTLAAHLCASAQQQGGSAAFIDAEHQSDMRYFARLGVNVDELELKQPDSGEEALELAELYARSGFSIVVIDSAAALIPKAEWEGDMGDNHMGLQARLIGQGCRKLSTLMGPKNFCNIIFINQIREKIGVMFGNPETTPGGRALKFFCGTRVDVRRGQNFTAKVDGRTEEVPVGHRLKVKAVKNKTVSPFQETEFSLYWGYGLHWIEDLLDLAAETPVLEKSGAWYSYGRVRLGQGRREAVQFLQTNPDVCHEILDKYLTMHNANKGLSPEGVPIPGFVPKVMPFLPVNTLDLAGEAVGEFDVDAAAEQDVADLESAT